MLKNSLLHFLRWCPGATGLYLRLKIYPRLLGKCGRNVLFGRFVDLYQPKRIVIGDNVVISNNVVLDAGEYDGIAPAINLGSGSFIGEGTTLKAGRGVICIGPGSSLGSFCHFNASVSITVGRSVLFAAYCKAGFLLEEGLRGNWTEDADNLTGDIVVEDGCWLGVRSFLLSGAQVGEGTIVGAHAVVNGFLPQYIIAVGRPAAILRRRTEPESSCEQENLQ